jgi:uncharacterized protein YdhG (YjbR/CyaY superfamily)
MPPPEMRHRPAIDSIDSYIDAADPAVRDILQAIRGAVARAVPDASECISYRMPAFRRKKVFVYFAAFRQHIGVYPPVQDDALAAELARYRGPKGNLRFPLNEPVPVALIARVAQSLARQVGVRPPA